MFWTVDTQFAYIIEKGLCQIKGYQQSFHNKQVNPQTAHQTYESLPKENINPKNRIFRFPSINCVNGMEKLEIENS